MPLSTIEPTQVAEAAAVILGQGRTVSGWSLRGIIGRGGPSNLEAMWNQLQSQAGDTSAPAASEAPALPPAVADHLAAATSRLTADLAGLVAQGWHAAADLATARVAAEVQAARQRADALEVELIEATAAITTADELIARLEVDLAQVREAVDGATAREAVSEARLAEVRATATAREAAVDGKLQEVRAALVAAERCAEAAGAELAKNAVSLVGAAERTAGLEADLARSKEDSAAAASREAATGARLEEVRAAVAAAERRAEIADARLAAVLAALRPLADQEVALEPESPEVPDRLAIPRPARDAYDDGRTKGKLEGLGAKPSKRFGPGERMGHLHHYWRAGHRDGMAIRAAKAAETATEEAAVPSDDQPPGDGDMSR